MKSCLIVDDSRVVRKVARRIIEDLGFECREAEDGQQACEACGQSLPDVVLLDWNMPVMNGLDFMGRLRGIEGGDNTLIIFCTIENEMGPIREAVEAGADEYIMKPFDSDIIESKFRQVGLIE